MRHSGSTTYEVPSGQGKGKPQFKPINCSSNGANTIVAAVTGYKIHVLAYFFVVTSAVTCLWESSGGTTVSGAMPLAANGVAPCPFSPVGHFETLKGEGLVLFLGSGVQVSGHLVYILI